jgi:hypothetical protein
MRLKFDLSLNWSHQMTDFNFLGFLAKTRHQYTSLKNTQYTEIAN